MDLLFSQVATDLMYLKYFLGMWHVLDMKGCQGNYVLKIKLDSLSLCFNSFIQFYE